MAISRSPKKRTKRSPAKKKKNLNRFLGFILISGTLIGAGYMAWKYIKGSLPTDPLNQYTVLAYGMAGTEVKELQRILNEFFEYFCALYQDKNWAVNGATKIAENGQFDDSTLVLFQAIQKTGGMLGGVHAPPQTTLIDANNELTGLPGINNRVCPQ